MLNLSTQKDVKDTLEIICLESQSNLAAANTQQTDRLIMEILVISDPSSAYHKRDL